MSNKTVVRVVIGLILVIIVAVVSQRYAKNHPVETPSAPTVAPTHEKPVHAVPTSTTAPAPEPAKAK